ncbi:MAG: biotin--[acetyl-CoA-carboxylase] ligase [Syntrophales bacterium]
MTMNDALLPDPKESGLTPAEIRQGLKTSLLGRGRIDYFPAIDSTNLHARRIADEGAPEGSIVVADAQHAGKGRRGRTWFSPPGRGIYLSIVLRPRIPPAEAPRLVLTAAVAAAEALLAQAALPLSVKWPNDILIGGKKAAGILMEMRLAGERISHVVIGLGVNVNTPAEEMPPEIRPIATSLCVATGRTFSRVALLRSLLEQLEQWYGLLQMGHFERIRKRWLELARIVGRRVTIAGVDCTYAGEVVDIDPTGFLILKSPDGTAQRILAGDVSMIDTPYPPPGPKAPGNSS